MTKSCEEPPIDLYTIRKLKGLISGLLRAYLQDDEDVIDS